MNADYAVQCNYYNATTPYDHQDSYYGYAHYPSQYYRTPLEHDDYRMYEDFSQTSEALGRARSHAEAKTDFSDPFVRHDSRRVDDTAKQELAVVRGHRSRGHDTYIPSYQQRDFRGRTPPRDRYDSRGGYRDQRPYRDYGSYRSYSPRSAPHRHKQDTQSRNRTSSPVRSRMLVHERNTKSSTILSRRSFDVKDSCTRLAEAFFNQILQEPGVKWIICNTSQKFSRFEMRDGTVTLPRGFESRPTDLLVWMWQQLQRSKQSAHVHVWTFDEEAPSGSSYRRKPVNIEVYSIIADSFERLAPSDAKRLMREESTLHEADLRRVVVNYR